MKLHYLKSVMMMASLCVPLLSSAQKVNEEDARQKAREFFNQKSKSESHAAKRRAVRYAGMHRQEMMLAGSNETMSIMPTFDKEDGANVTESKSRDNGCTELDEMFPL